MARQGNTIAIGTPEQPQAAFRSELAKYAWVVKKVGLEPQEAPAGVTGARPVRA